MNRIFSRFSGAGNPVPLAFFRMAFFAGLGLHFFPSLIWWRENYSPQVYRTKEWSTLLFDSLPFIPEWGVVLLALITAGACVAAFAGFHFRISAILTGLGLYLFASFNALQTQTLALVTAWAILLIFALAGGGDEAFALGKIQNQGPRLARGLIVFQLMFAFFFAGIEKLLEGWPLSNEMNTVFNYPNGFIARAWVIDAHWLHSKNAGLFASAMTLCVELGVPMFVLLNRGRTLALIVYQVFFLVIIATMEVPPLFYFMFASGGLLALDDTVWNRLFPIKTADAPRHQPGESFVA